MSRLFEAPRSSESGKEHGKKAEGIHERGSTIYHASTLPVNAGCVQKSSQAASVPLLWMAASLTPAPAPPTTTTPKAGGPR